MLTLDTLNQKLNEATEAFIENQKKVGSEYASTVKKIAEEAEESPIDQKAVSVILYSKGVELESRLTEVLQEVFEL